MAGRPQVVITDSDLASTADERVLHEGGCATIRLQARTEGDLVAALARTRAEALIVQWAPVSAAVPTRTSKKSFRRAAGLTG